MIEFVIPGSGKKQIRHLVFDYNGTLARDGVLIPGVKDAMAAAAGMARIHVITADTFGSVKTALSGTSCSLTLIPETNQDQAKLDYITGLGPEQTLCAGNGANDALMLRHAAIGIAVLQEEGMAISALLAADLVVRDILDVFALLKIPQRLIATLRI